MKRLTGIILAIITLPAFAQDYELIRANMDRIYGGDYASRLGLRIDSVEEAAPMSGDTLYHGYHQVGEIGDFCVRHDAPFWLGDPILKKENGDFQFHNLDGEPILIKNQSNMEIGYEWECYTTGDLQNVLTVKAIVDTITYEDFIGLTDSVKYIRFQAYGEEGDEVDCPVNNKTLKISKNHGLIQTPAFVVFPDINSYQNYYPASHEVFQVLGMTYPDQGISNLTKLEAFDFNPGDEIHTKYYHYTWELSRTQRDKILRCLDKEILSDDSVINVMERQMWYKKEIFNSDGTIDSVIETTTFDTVNKLYTSSPRFDSYPKETYIDSSSRLNLVYQNTMSGGFIGPSKRLDIPVGHIYHPDSCMSVGSSDGCFVGNPNGRYYKGLGGPYYYCTYGFSEYERELVYWKKGDEQWGEPLDIVITDNEYSSMSSENQCNIYPNPADEYFVVEGASFSFDNSRLEIYNSMGRKIKEYQLDSHKTRLTHSLSSGIYFYKVLSGNSILKTGKLIIK